MAPILLPEQPPMQIPYRLHFFRNEATLVEPTLSQRFTPELQELFLRQTNLTLVNNPNADLRLEGEITGYRINPDECNSTTNGCPKQAYSNCKCPFLQCIE